MRQSVMARREFAFEVRARFAYSHGREYTHLHAC